MQVKKFEAPTLQEALETIKRELGPEAIILQTKQNRRGFGLMSRGSVEVTAAVSDRSMKKKEVLEKRLPDAYVNTVSGLPAQKQADAYDRYFDAKLKGQAQVTKDQVQISSDSKKITAVRYADIEDDESQINSQVAEQKAKSVAQREQQQVIAVPPAVAKSIETLSHAQEELAQLKLVVEELKRERLAQSFIDVDAPYMVTEALQSAFESLIHSGLERRFAVETMRKAAIALDPSGRVDTDQVLDQVARSLFEKVEVVPFFPEAMRRGQGPQIVALVGLSGVGKTSLIGKLSNHAARKREERVAVMRIQNTMHEEQVDPLQILSKALHIPYRTVSDAESFAIALEDLAGCDWIFIDTPAQGLRDGRNQANLEALLHSDPRVRIQIVVSAATREMELAEIARTFSRYRPESLFFTKLDEALAFGGMLSLAERMKLPMAIFTTGRRVTEDWESATPERIVANVLDI